MSGRVLAERRGDSALKEMGQGCINATLTYKKLSLGIGESFYMSRKNKAEQNLERNYSISKTIDIITSFFFRGER